MPCDKQTFWQWVASLLPANKYDVGQLTEQLNKIMSAISDFATKQNAFNDRQDAAVAGLTDDIAAMSAEILKLQNSPGTITPEDQASLDALQARSEAATTKLETLDSLTPPKPPVA